MLRHGGAGSKRVWDGEAGFSGREIGRFCRSIRLARMRHPESQEEVTP